MERILWFDEQLRAGRNPRSADLAARFDVSLRTAQRDIEAMRDRLQAPLKHLHGGKGYAYGDKSFDLPSAFFRKEELVALLYARRLFREIRPPLKAEAESISARLDEMFRSPLLEKLEDAVSFDIGQRADIPERIFFDMLRAILRKLAVRIHFHPYEDGEASGRGFEAEPLGLHFAHGNWVLLAHAGKKKGVCAYPLARMRRVEVTGRHFVHSAMAAAADAAARRGTAIFRGGMARGVRIRFSPGRADRISAQRWHPEQRVQFGLDGSAVLEIPEARVLWVLGLVLQERGEAAVIAPAELRDAVQSEIDRLSAAYPDRKR
ncbi:MAG: WYL domain-containing protein [Deltaproteobacteria bacterium]|nr:WYL domain-containing protein [Deltaproteobacteria bacterium]